jgi:hypothetical protein
MIDSIERVTEIATVERLVDPETEESLRWHEADEDHEAHWDYVKRRPREKCRIYPDGRKEPKP